MTTVGILGAGQLGRMLVLAGYPLGVHFHCFDPAADSPVDGLAPRTIAAYDDTTALDAFAASVDVITFEFENVPVATARYLSAQRPLWPPPAALEAAQDRLIEKTFFQERDIPTPPFAAIDTKDDLDAAVQRIKLPAVLKTRRMGYDGKGQFVLRNDADVALAWEALGGVPLILEGFIHFDREVSLLAVRSTTGETKFYPLVQNTHREGILRLSLAPAPDRTAEMQSMAQAYAARILDDLGYVGVLAIELFQVGTQLIANEMAPRVHNSGHWTIEGAETSQFENHLRAVLGLPLGATTTRGHSAMLNLIGALPEIPATLVVPHTHLHLYDKAPRPGRKIGHITVRTDDLATLQTSLGRLQPLIHE